MTPTRSPPKSTIQEAAYRIASAHPHGLSQVRLLKLLWLAELRHLEEHGERITPAGWWRWDFGPYSKDVINAVRTNPRHFKVTQDDQATTVGGRIIEATKAQVGNTLSDSAEAVLDEVVDLYGAYGTQELLAEVYADPFFDNTPFGDDFDFESLSKHRKVVPAPRAKKLLALETRPVESVDALFG